MTLRKPRVSLFAKIVFLMTFGTISFTAFSQQSDQPANNPLPTQPDSTEIYTKLGGSISAPKLVHAVEPKLSKTVRTSKESQTASVRLKLVVEPDGTTSNITVIGVFDKNGAPIADADGNPIYVELKEGAVEAAKQYKFEPGKRNGKPVRVQLIVAIDYYSYSSR